MEIKAEKSAYHIFAFYYSYDPSVVDFCRALKEEYGWQNFTFNTDEGQKRRVFSDVKFIEQLRRKFPNVVVSPEAEYEYNKTYMTRSAALNNRRRLKQ